MHRLVDRWSIAGRAARGAGRARRRVRRRAGRWSARSATCRTRGPPLSKELLAGEHDGRSGQLPCDKLEAQWRLGVSAASLDRARRRVVLADGDEVAYDRLIVATGSRARSWPGAGAELDGVHVLARPR